MPENSLQVKLLAKDAFLEWASLVKSAEESILIFTPFLDDALIDLLNNTPYLDWQEIKIITNFDEDYLLKHPNQLYTIKSLLEIGAQVSSLKNLHAKVLIVDDKWVVVGSQNFTNHGRQNREVSVSGSESIEDTDFLKVLQDWESLSDPVDGNLVDKLIEVLPDIIDALQEIEERGTEKFRETVMDHQKQERVLKFKRLRDQSQFKLTVGEIPASIEYLKSGEYYRLKAEPIYDLTKWNTILEDGSETPYELDRLFMCPILLAESLRMGFARVGQHVITYIREGLDADSEKFNVDYLSFDVELVFPSEETEKVNIIVTLQSQAWGNFKSGWLFDGDSISVVWKNYSAGYFSNASEEVKQAVYTHFFDDAKKIEEFYNQFFEPFKYETGGLEFEKKNITEFLEETDYRLGLIQYQKHPVLVIE